MTPEEIKEYLSGETIKCLLCGERKQILTQHLKFKHGLTDDEYREEFDIPYTAGLISKTFKDRKAQISRDGGHFEHIRSHTPEATIKGAKASKRRTKNHGAYMNKLMCENSAKGEGHGHSFLKEEEVIDICKSDVLQRELADQYGTTQGNISCIQNRKTWAHTTKKPPPRTERRGRIKGDSRWDGVGFKKRSEK